MGQKANEISIITAGTTTTTSGSSQEVGLPDSAAGADAKFVRVCSPGNVYIKFGLTGLTCTANDIMIAANCPEVFKVHGCTHYAVLQETAGAKVNVTAVEMG